MLICKLIFVVGTENRGKCNMDLGIRHYLKFLAITEYT